jgi:hypothetical protein
MVKIAVKKSLVFIIKSKSMHKIVQLYFYQGLARHLIELNTITL